MNETQAIGAIGMMCALILIGSAIVRRRIAPRSMLALIGLWLAIIVLGVVVAKLWLLHYPV